MQNTTLNLSDTLPLTCSRSGNCCHGNKVLLNPWELAYLAAEKHVSTTEFRNLYTEWRGVRLKFAGAVRYNEKQACNLYLNAKGCSVHIARPLACRLFPLGRQIQNNEIIYMYQGEQFPCLEGCSEVLDLPKLSVSEYLIEQQTEKWEVAQNNYLEIVQLLADVAFDLLLDSELAHAANTKTLTQWRLMANESPLQLAERIDMDWLDLLITPDIKHNILQPQAFCEQHATLLRQKLQTTIACTTTTEELEQVTILTMAMSLLLAVAVGAEPYLLANHWINIAISNGAKG